METVKALKTLEASENKDYVAKLFRELKLKFHIDLDKAKHLPK